MEISLLLQLVGYAAGLVGVYVKLNTKITKLEAQSAQNETMNNELRHELKEIKELIIQLRIDTAISKNRIDKGE